MPQTYHSFSNVALIDSPGETQGELHSSYQLEFKGGGEKQQDEACTGTLEEETETLLLASLDVETSSDCSPALLQTGLCLEGHVRK